MLTPLVFWVGNYHRVDTIAVLICAIVIAKYDRNISSLLIRPHLLPISYLCVYYFILRDLPSVS